MKKNITVNKGVMSKNSGNIELVDGGYVKNYGGMIAIGYISNKTERFLSVSLEDLKSFIADIEDRCIIAVKNPDGKCKGYQKSRINDEPSEKCKECENFELYEV